MLTRKILLFAVGFEAFIVLILFVLSHVTGNAFSLWSVLWQSFLGDVLPVACIGVVAAWWRQGRGKRRWFSKKSG